MCAGIAPVAAMIAELDDIVEMGPNWNEIEQSVIRLSRPLARIQSDQGAFRRLALFPVALQC